MKTILVVGLIVAALLTITLTSMKRHQGDQQEGRSDSSDWKDRGTVAWHVKKAKERGDKEIFLPGPQVENVDNLRDINEALKFYSVVVAEPVEKKSFYQSPLWIATWYKLRVIETLSPRPFRQCVLCPSSRNAPLEMSSLNSDEILVSKTGGTVDIDGVKVTMGDSGFPDFEVSKKYLLFLEVDSTGQQGAIMVGPNGTFKVNEDETITPVTRGNHSLKNIMKAQFNDSVRSLREKTKGHSGSH
jgi:hypothetical protein